MKSMDRQCLLNLGVIVGKSTVMQPSSSATTLIDGRDLVAVGQPQQHYSQPVRTTTYFCGSSCTSCSCGALEAVALPTG